MSNHQGSHQTSEQFYMEAVELLQFAFNICGGVVILIFIINKNDLEY